MTISYNWLSEYLPQTIAPEKLSEILTSIGLEVESIERFQEVKGGLNGLLVGEVISCEKHPEADKLKLTTVSIGKESLLNIVCGAANVTTGQKVIVAPIGCTIYPTSGDPITIKKAKIRGAESEGMICAEDEIGLGNNHDGIRILAPETIVGTEVATLFKPYEDYIFEIGLTPNRMDAMSHLGVAKDVCAYLSYHNQTPTHVRLPYPTSFTSDTPTSNITVSIENEKSCVRYSGVLISDIIVEDSPAWLQQKIKSIGLHPINNIVDITNFILHETGQPLHAFDAAKIVGNKIVVKNALKEQPFKTLDEKDRKLQATDLMIWNAAAPMCIAGVYGGVDSGVGQSTTSVFLESACFDGGSIRKTSIFHGLRTDAATRFEKGVDISNTVTVLKRAATLIKEITSGKITGDVIDIYPAPIKKTTVILSAAYLKKLSGKEYNIGNVKNILVGLGFEILNQSDVEIEMAVPFSKPDISIPADIVEEIMRIDGLDNIEIPSTINIAPSVDKDNRKFALKEKMANYLIGLGFYEIFTNSISNSAFYNEELLKSSVKMINSLSAELDMLRPRMIQSGLQVVAHNLNRKNNNLRLFEFGKTYSSSEAYKYAEQNHLCLYVSGQLEDNNWKIKTKKADFYYIKGVVDNILRGIGLINTIHEEFSDGEISTGSSIKIGKTIIGQYGEVASGLLKQFDVKHPVFYIDLNWDNILSHKIKPIQYKEISKFPSVNRDLAVLVDKNVSYSQIEQIALSSKIDQLTSIQLFDVFESEKLGADKKSMAVSFTFLDETKTLTDKEIDGFVQKIVTGFETNLKAEIRK